MSDWTKLDQARVAFLDASVAYHRAIDKQPEECAPGQDSDALLQKQSLAWDVYRELLDGKEENAPFDEHRFFCPHCGKERPKYAMQLIGEALLGIGAIQYFNVICGEENCRKLLTVSVIGFVPEAQMIDLARAQMKRFGGQA